MNKTFMLEMKINITEMKNIKVKKPVLSLNLIELSRIRNKVQDKYKNLLLENLISKLQLENLDIYIKILDLKYENKKIIIQNLENKELLYLD